MDVLVPQLVWVTSSIWPKFCKRIYGAACLLFQLAIFWPLSSFFFLVNIKIVAHLLCSVRLGCWVVVQTSHFLANDQSILLSIHWSTLCNLNLTTIFSWLWSTWIIIHLIVLYFTLTGWCFQCSDVDKNQKQKKCRDSAIRSPLQRSELDHRQVATKITSLYPTSTPGIFWNDNLPLTRHEYFD